MKHSVPHASVYTPLALTNVRGACVCRAEEKDGCHCFDVCFAAPALQRQPGAIVSVETITVLQLFL